MSEYFTESKTSGGISKVDIDLSNYATKEDLKNATSVDTSYFAKKTDLVHLKFDVDKLDINKVKKVSSNLSNLKSKVDKLEADKLVSVPVDLSKLSEKYNAKNVKRMYNAKIKDIEDKIPDITNLTTNLNANIHEVKNEIPSITNLSTTTALTIVENKIPSHNKYITTSEFYKLTAEDFAAKLKQADLVTKSDDADFVKKTDLDGAKEKSYLK